MTGRRIVLSFPDSVDGAARRSLRRDVIQALTTSESPVIVNLSGRHTLDHDDIAVLLDCIAQAAGRDTQLFIVAGSRAVQVLLEVIRISSLVPVFNSIEEAVCDLVSTADGNFAGCSDADRLAGNTWSA